MYRRTCRDETLPSRFWSKVKRAGPDECWEWQAYRDPNGYGRIGFAGRSNTTASRVSWALQVGPIPEGLFVLHHCDNPPCVNVRHLYVGTPKQNMRDFMERGQGDYGDRRGSKNANARLSERDVIEMRRERSERGTSYSNIGAQFGITTQYAWLIVNGKRWAHVKEGLPS